MWPVGTYERMVYDIKARENPYLPVTFGVLIADYRQQKAREYILNYISRFDKLTGKYINFYLPGYLEERDYGWDGIDIRGLQYRFSPQEYMKFLESFSYDFDIDYPYNPVLVLIEYDRGHFKFSRKITIELDSDGSKIEQSGRLIERIVDIAKEYVSLDDFSTRLTRDAVGTSLLERIIEATNNAMLVSISKGVKDATKYRIC